MEHMKALAREVVLTLFDEFTVEKIPHQLQVHSFQCLVHVPGRPPLCSRRNRVGQARSHRRTPKCRGCNRNAELVDPCLTTYGDKLRGQTNLAPDIHNAFIMKVTEGVNCFKGLMMASGYHPHEEASPENQDSQK